MKSFWGIIPRYFKTGKKRITYAAVGIIASITLIVSLGTISQALKASIFQKMKDDSGGIHDIYIGTVGYVDFNRVACEPTIKEFTNVWPIARYKIPNRQNILQISAFKDNASDILNLNLLEGRYPENDKEIALEQWILDLLPEKYEIGDTITLPCTFDFRGRSHEIFKEEGKAEFILTGIYTFTYRSWFYPKEGTGYITQEYGEKLLKDHGILMESVEADGYALLNPGYTVDEAITLLTQSRYPTGGFFPNEAKLALKDEYKKYDSILLSISIILVIIAGIIIYNIFNVSISERINEFGMLRAIGCPPWKLRIMIITEGLIIAVICIPIGLILGNIITRFIIRMITGIEGLSGISSISPKIIITAIAVGISTTLLGTIFPAHRAGAVSPVEAMKGTASKGFGGNSKLRLNSKVLKRFSFEGKMAISNVIKNKKRLVSTCLSLIITITMFITINYIVSSTNPEAVFKESFKVDFKIATRSGFSLKALESVKGFDITKKIMRKGITMDVDKEKFTEKGIKTYEELANKLTYVSNCLFQGRYYIDINVVGYSDEELKGLNKYLIEGNIDGDKLKEGDSGILVQNINGLDYTTLQVGDVIQPAFQKYDDNGEYIGGSFPKFTITALLSEEAIKGVPIDEHQAYMQSAVLILPKSTLEKYMNLTTYQYIEGNVAKGYDYEEVENELRIMADSNKGSTFSSYREELEKVRVNNAQIIFAMYSIVIVVAIVSIINLINIMSMSAIMRKKEFGYMRAVGLDSTKVKKLIVWEGVLYGVISCIISIIISIPITYIISINSLGWIGQQFTWHIPYVSMILTTAVVILITVLASILPSKILFKTNIVESIRDIE